FVTQGREGIETGGTARRVEPKENPDYCRDERRGRDRVGRNRHRPSQDTAEDEAGADTEDHPKNAAEQGQHLRLDDLVRAANVEVVLLPRLDMMPLAQERGDLIDGGVHRLL